MSFEIGSTVGDYQVVAILGAGGMGQVYKVRNVISDRVEAMKVLLPDLVNSPDLADRFLREIKVQASLEHPNIAALHTAVRLDNQLLMLIEFVEGVTLEQKARQGPLPAVDAVNYIMQALAALDYAHSRGVVHRDIKPANMMLTPGGVVKLMDFGIAKAATDQKLTMTGTTVGSLYYMSPEQIQGATALDARSDLYSVGVSLYELVTGKRPFDGDSQFAIMSAHLAGTPVPPITVDPRLPLSLNDVILMSVLKDPNERFQTAGALRNALANVDAELNAAPAQPAAAQIAATQKLLTNMEPAIPAQPSSRRGLWMGLGAVAAVLAIAAVIGIAPWKGAGAAPLHIAVPAPQPTAPAQPVSQPPAQVAAPLQSQPPQSQPQEPVALTPKPQSAAAIVRQPRQGPGVPPVVAPVPKADSAPAQPAAPPPAQQAAQIQPQTAGQQPAPVASSRAELQQSREQLAMLGVRAAGIHTSLQTLQRSQAASGLNLRGDMQEAASLMATYLEGANAALTAGDAPQTTRFMDKAERQVEKLEKFLNR